MPLLAPLYTALLHRYVGNRSSEMPAPAGDQILSKAVRCNGFSRAKKSGLGNTTDLEFQQLVPGTGAHAWSRGAEPETRKASNLQDDKKQIRIDRKVEWSSKSASEGGSAV